MWKPDLIEDIEEFHEKYGLEYKDPISRHLLPEEKEFRARCMLEEIQEYIAAKTLEEEVDAIIDLIYFALGTSYRHGFNFYDGWREVHRANMSKVRATKAQDSKRNFELDVVKPDDWKAPELDDAVTKEINPATLSHWKGHYATKRRNITDAQAERIIKDCGKLPPAPDEGS
mgnify:FL=1